ncbi:RfaG Glycosyltransferase [actinobacterium SCGC AAA044-D11]
MIARVNRGGTARWLDELIKELQKAGHQTVLYAGSVQGSESEDECFSIHNGKRISGLGRSIALWGDFQAILQVRKILKRELPDVLNTHTAKAGVIGRLAALSLGKKRPAIVHTIHGHLLYGYFSKTKTFIFMLIEKLLASRSDVLIAAGNKVKDELLWAGIGREEIYVVARPSVRLHELESKSVFRAKLEISENEIVIGWLGRLAQVKRPDRVIELAKKLNNLIFVIGGDGDLYNSLRIDLPSNVRLVGWTRPEEIWAASDIALLTSDNEAQPISLIEAGLAGIPAVAENVGSVSEVIDDRVTGILVSSLEERIDAINSLVKNKELRLQMGKSARDYCENKFGHQQFLETHIKAYEKALKKRGPKP